MIINGKKCNINRSTAIVSEWDKVYCDLLKKILSDGEKCHNRTGIDTLSIEGFNFKLNVGEQFPILESKKVNIKNALSEMLWIFQAQSNDVSWLQQKSNNIWNEWRVDYDGIYRTYEPNCEYDAEKEVQVLDLDGKEVFKDKKALTTKSIIEGKTIKSAKYYGKKYAGTIGTAYGWINNKFKRPQYVLDKLKTDPQDRRMVISLWQDEYLRTAVLPSCVWSSEWKVCNGKLNAYVHQRSADTPLGLPFNVSQYSILLAMFAKVSNFEIGNINWSIMDAHIYENQVQGIKLQLERYKKMIYWERVIQTSSDKDVELAYLLLKNKQADLMANVPYKNSDLILNEINENILVFELMLTKTKPVLEIANKNDFFEFNNDVNNDKLYLNDNPTGNEDIKVLKYTSAPHIKMPIAQ